MQANDQPKSNVIPLPGAMTIETVESLAAQLKDIPGIPPVLVLDAVQTEIITTPGIQLLIALSKTLASQGIALVLTQPKASFSEAFENTGLAAHLKEWRHPHE